MSSLYVRRTARIHPLRPLDLHAEDIDGDTTAIVRPYVLAQQQQEEPVPLCGAETGPWATDAERPRADL